MLIDTQQAIQCTLQKIDANLVTFADLYPDDTTSQNVYPPRRAGSLPVGSNVGWTTSFWSGMLWLAYLYAGDERYRRAGEHHVQSFTERIEQKMDVDHHDLGFLYTLSCITPWRLIGNEQAKQTALQAADHLMTRYLDTAGIIQAWGNLDDPNQRGRTIIDSLMNMPLLFWAGEMTGKPHYAKAAYRHGMELRDHMVRPDNTTYHTYFWDPNTGAPLHGNTAQGFSDDSCWARGQAWAMYGFALCYRHTRDETLLESAMRCTDYFLDHLPEDQVVYWDLTFAKGSTQPRDSSAAAIAVCGLQEIVKWLAEGVLRQRYQDAAETILASLIANYTTCNDPESNALLLHGVYNLPGGIGVDEGTLWGDYFYLEALMRQMNPGWQLFW